MNLLSLVISIISDSKSFKKLTKVLVHANFLNFDNVQCKLVVNKDLFVKNRSRTVVTLLLFYYDFL